MLEVLVVVGALDMGFRMKHVGGIIFPPGVRYTHIPNFFTSQGGNTYGMECTYPPLHDGMSVFHRRRYDGDTFL
jgi:hypothetical protein